MVAISIVKAPLVASRVSIAQKQSRSSVYVIPSNVFPDFLVPERARPLVSSLLAVQGDMRRYLRSHGRELDVLSLPPPARDSSSRVMAEKKLFDLSDLENTVGSWDMYGQDDSKRYNGLQSDFFERAASGLTRREYLNALVALGGGASLLIWGAKGSIDAALPITKGPQKPAEVGPRGRL
jgi:photosystem I subunit 6